jgi:hypothetical protein
VDYNSLIHGSVAGSTGLVFTELSTLYISNRCSSKIVQGRGAMLYVHRLWSSLHIKFTDKGRVS